MFFKNLCILVLCTKVASALEGLRCTDCVVIPKNLWNTISSLIPADHVSDQWGVDTVHVLCDVEVASILHIPRHRVAMIMAAVSVVAETVEVLHTQVQPLKTASTHQNQLKTSSEQMV